MRIDVVAHCLHEAGLEPILVRAAHLGGDAVHVALHELVGGLAPAERELELHAVLVRLVEGRGSGRHDPLAAIGDQLGDVLGDAAVVTEGHLGLWLRRLVHEDDLEPLVQVALRLEALLDQLHVEGELVAEDLRVRREGDGRARAARIAHRLELRGRLAAAEGLVVVLSVALDLGDELGREGVDHRRADAVQTARVGVVLLLELPAGVQRGEDHLERRLVVLLHHVDGDAAPIVTDGHGVTVLVQPHLDARGVAVHDFIDRVVDDLPEEVVIPVCPRAADVHAGANAHGLEALEHLDVGSVVFLGSHYFFSGLSVFGSGRSTNSSAFVTVLISSFFDISRPLPPRPVTS